MVWVNQAEIVGEKWVSYINEMIKHMEKRFEAAERCEQAIR